jgi:F-type H+-transporting ATPase subunit b
MLIDWFTVCAQIVNFLILVWLLKKFLYGRILRAIDERESRIAARLAEAGVMEKQAGDQLALYQAKLQDFEQTHESMLAQARVEADTQRAELLDKAREEVHSLETKWQEDLERERHAFVLDLRRRVALEILTIVRRTVADLTGTDVQQCAIRVFLERFRSLDSDGRKRFAQGELSIRSPFELSEATRAEIQRTMEKELEKPVNLRFERAPEMGLGLELRGNGWRVGWNSESYLEALEEDLKEAFEHSAEPMAHVGSP